MLTSDEIRAIEASEFITIRLPDRDDRRAQVERPASGTPAPRTEGAASGKAPTRAKGPRGRLCIVSPPPRAPWWRVERAYRRRGIDPMRAEIGIGERWLRRFMALSAIYLAAHLVAAWLRR